MIQAPARAAPVERAPAHASPRKRYTLNEGWKFGGPAPADARRSEYPDGAWSAVNLPHTWNAEDTMDDVPGYRRGVGWYRRQLALSSELRGRRLFLYFEGANQVADVYLNGNHVGRHVGGYTAFAFEITDFVRFGDAGDANLIAVRVDNSLDKDVPPINGDFNMYGGIYRDVWLVATDAVHIKVTDAASPGVWIDTPRASDDAAMVRVRGSLVNDGGQAQTVAVVSTVTDAAARSVATLRTTMRLAAKEEKSFEQSSEAIPRPQLWSPERPYLYTVRTSVHVNGRVVDEIANPLGFRWFSFDAGRGFILNGQPLKLRGTNRHQDYRGLGNAVPDALHARDLEIIKDAGFNFVRLAHYPQDPRVLEAADRLGLILWEEIPVVNQITPSEAFAANAKRMLTEMIRQHRNHPSVVLWGYMNEVFLPPPKDEGVVRATVKLARELEEVCRLEDPSRATAIAFDHGARELYNSSGLGDVAQVVGWNLYHGWYYETFADFGKFLDEEHRRFPRRPLIVSEYGANGDPRLHSLAPRRYDSTVEWQRMFHEAYLPQINARPFVAGAAVWNQFDFGSEFRGETIPHINQKGLFTFDRQPKDVHYYYKANFSAAPVLHIATRDWLYRAGAGDTGAGAKNAGRSTQAVDVYTNLEAVVLLHDGRPLGWRRVGAARRVTWNVPFHGGMNMLSARGRRRGQTMDDNVAVFFTQHASALASPALPFTELAVNVGSHAQFVDAGHTVWEADQPYRPGGWGYVGDDVKSVAASQNIPITTEDPLYQTMRQGLSAYRFDVPDGDYEVELRFVETEFKEPGQRVFDVRINGDTFAERFDPARACGVMHPCARLFRVRAARGVSVEFMPVREKPILSAVRIRRAL